MNQPISTIVVGVGAVIIVNNKILLIKRGHEPYTGHWTLPGGTLIWQEKLQAALVREVKEETDLDIEVKGLAGIVESIHPSGEFHFIIIDYFADVIGGELRPGDDAQDARWVALPELSTLQVTPLLVEHLTRFGVPV